MSYSKLLQYLRNHFFGVGDGLPFEGLFLLFAFFDFGLVPEAGLVAVCDGEGAVFGTFGDDALGPDAVGEVGPVVVAAFELLPGVFEDFLPGIMAEVLPEGGGGDLDAVVEVGLPEFGDGFEGVFKGAQLGELGVEGFEPGVVLRAAAFAVREGVALGGHLARLLLDAVDAAQEGLVVEAVVVEPEGVDARGGGARPVEWLLAEALAVAG